jgi:hypothetical protein
MATADGLTVYGFTSDNTKRPPEQTAAFRQACVDAVDGLSKREASLLIVGNDDSSLFPSELKPYKTRRVPLLCGKQMNEDVKIINWRNCYERLCKEHRRDRGQE